MSTNKEEFPHLAALGSGATPALSRLREVERKPFTWCDSCNKGFEHLGKCDSCESKLVQIGWYEV